MSTNESPIGRSVMDNDISFVNILDNYKDYYELLRQENPKVVRLVRKAYHSPYLRSSFRKEGMTNIEFRDRIKMATVMAAFCLGSERLAEVTEECLDAVIYSMLSTMNSAIHTNSMFQGAAFSMLVNLTAMVSIDRYPSDPQGHYSDTLEYLEVDEETQPVLLEIVQIPKPTIH